MSDGISDAGDYEELTPEDWARHRKLSTYKERRMEEKRVESARLAEILAKQEREQKDRLGFVDDSLWDLAPPNPTVCPRCGAVVAEREAHVRWHVEGNH